MTKIQKRVLPFDVQAIMCGSSIINLDGKKIRIINSAEYLSGLDSSDIVIVTHKVMRKSHEIVCSLVKKGGKLIVH